MAITWGSWEYSGGNGMRVGIEAIQSSVSTTSTSCTVSFKVYTQNQYWYDDNQSLAASGTNPSWGSTSYHNGSSGGSVIRRATYTYTYTYAAGDYGTGTAKAASITVGLSGAYNGVTPSATLTHNIPKRPLAAPDAQTGVTAIRSSDTSTTLSWTLQATTAKPYDTQRVDRWDHLSGEYAILNQLVSGTSTQYAVPTVANRRYRMRVFAKNAAGWSPAAYSDYIQTAPAAPSACTATGSSSSSALITWRIGAAGGAYEYDTLIEEQVDGGAWNVLTSVPARAAKYARDSLTPGSVYAWRVRHRSRVGATTYSNYSTSGTVQLIAAPAAPTSLTITRKSDYSFTLGWANAATSMGPYDRLVLQRWSSTTNTWDALAAPAATATSFTDNSTKPNTGYKWRIRAENAAGAVW